MDIVSNIRNLCKLHKTSIRRVEARLKFGNGTIRKWNESPPSINRIIEVAKFFGVSLEVVTGYQIKKETV